MAETDGSTCRTCMTLNPSGAPACVRCNTPLPGPADAGRAPGAAIVRGTATAEPARAYRSAVPALDPTTGAKQIGPGLAACGRAAPGSSSAAAAAVQPPGYGPPGYGPHGYGPHGYGPHGCGPPAGDRSSPDTRPADLHRARRRVTLAGLAVVVLVLAAGSTALWLTRPRHVDTAAVAGALGAELTARLGGPVTVDCPPAARRRAGETFTCTARDAAGVRRTVTVTLLDDAGRYRWRLDPGP